MEPLKNKIKDILSKNKKVSFKLDSFAHSSVLLIINRHNDDDFILFTKRAESLNHHSGQISFPGGLQEKGDKSLLETALRETREELGIDTDGFEILGEIDDTITISSKYIITPFVAYAHNLYNFKVNSSEIEKIIEVPLSFLLDRDVFKEKDWSYEGIDYKAHYFYYDGEMIWGATARILKQFIDLIKEE